MFQGIDFIFENAYETKLAVCCKTFSLLYNKCIDLKENYGDFCIGFYQNVVGYKVYSAILFTPIAY